MTRSAIASAIQPAIHSVRGGAPVPAGTSGPEEASAAARTVQGRVRR